MDKQKLAVVCLLAVAGVLATYNSVASVRGRLALANRAVARADLQSIAESLDKFAVVHHGLYPATLAELLAKDERGNGYLAGDIIALPLDPWRHPFVYLPSASRDGCRVMSYGADGAPGGEGEAQDLFVDSHPTTH